MIRIEQLRREQAGEFWKLRLEALKSHPEAFGSSYEEQAGTPMHEVELKINTEPGNYIQGAFTGKNELVGMAGFRREQAIKMHHKGMIWGVYVSQASRGQGIAGKLIREILLRGEELEGLRQIQLAVVTTNLSAAALYKKLGFVTYGIEKDALRVQGQTYDEELMAYYYERYRLN